MLINGYLIHKFCLSDIEFGHESNQKWNTLLHPSCILKSDKEHCRHSGLVDKRITEYQAVSYLHFYLVRFLRVKAETLSRACSTGAARPLLGGGLADGCDQQGFHSDAWVIHLIGYEKVSLR